ncbi:MAG: NAD-dependent epimerase/dehydratase family protein, partial [Omnitrophica WOR_2 bacterium]
AGAPQEIFRVNSLGTFNIFQAAAEAGITRVVQASSINASGQFYGLKPAPLCYLPLDEDHPVTSTDPYSFTKHIIEEIGEYFWRREGISSLALRLPYVAPVHFREIARQNSIRIQTLVETLLKRPVEDRLLWFQTAWDGYNSFRAGRPYEILGYARKAISNMPDDQRSMFATMMNRVNFFTYVDERDSAQAFEKGLTAIFKGSHNLFINDSRNWTGVESKLLAELFYPDVKVFKRELKDNETLVSIDKARQLIGYEPEFTFGNQPE